ncbi:MAG: hypothetical protein OHK0046_25340 [Anaerolineae bacterium]
MANLSDIFISYSRRNTEFARRLFDEIKRSGREAWADWEDIPYSVDFLNEIKAGIDAAETFVVIISPPYMMSQVCNIELDYAIQNHKRIIPVIHIDVDTKTAAPEWAKLEWNNLCQSNWAHIQKLNWLFFREGDDFDASFKNLIEITERDPEYVRLHTWLLVRARDWEARNRSASGLLSGDEIGEAENWLRQAEGENPGPTPIHREYIAESRRIEDNRKRLLQRLRAATIGLAVVGLIAVLATVFSLIQANTAQSRADQANQTLEVANAELAVIDVTVEGASTAQAIALEQAANAQSEATNAAFFVITATIQQGAAEQARSTAEIELRQAGETLTPVPLTLTPAAELLASARDDANAAQQDAVQAREAANQASTAVLESGLTLTPVPLTLTYAADRVDSAVSALATSDAQIATADSQLVVARTRAAQAEDDAARASTQVAAAEVQVTEAAQQVANANATLTPIPQTLTPAAIALQEADNSLGTANAQAATADAQVIQAREEVSVANATLSPVPQTLEAAYSEITQVAQSNATAIAAQSTAAADAGTAVARANDANTRLEVVQVQVTEAQQLANNAQGTSVAAGTEAADAALLAQSAGAQASTADAQAATAVVLVTEANVEAVALQTQIVVFGETLTPVSTIVEGANALVTQAAQAVVEANVAVTDTYATLEPIQGTLVAAQTEAEQSARLALSQSLANNAELAINNGNYDQAIALLLESSRLNPDLTQTQRLLNRTVYDSARLNYTDARDAAFSPVSDLVAVVEGSTIVLATAQNRQEVARMQGHTANINAIAFSPDGRFLASGSDDTTVILWDISTGTALRTLSGHTGAVQAVQFNPLDGSTVLSASTDNASILWNTSDGSIRRRFSLGNNRTISRVQFNANGQRFITWEQAGPDTVMTLWNVNNNQPITTIQGYQYESFGGTDNQAAVDNRTNQFVVTTNAFDLNLNITRTFTTGFNFNSDLIGVKALSRANPYVLAAISSDEGARQRLWLMNITTGALLREFSGDGIEQVNALAFSPDGGRVLSGFGGFLILWDVNTGQEVRRFAAHSDTVESIQFSDDGRFALSRSRDGNVRVWDVTNIDPTLENQIEAPIQPDDLRHISFSPDGSSIYAASGTVVYAWNTTTRERTNSVQDALGILNVIYSPVQEYALTIRNDAALIYDMAQLFSGRVASVGAGTERFTGSGAFSPDGTLVVIEDENTITVRNVPANTRKSTLSRQSVQFGQHITDFEFSPDNMRVYGAVELDDDPASAPGPLIIWNAETGEEIGQLDTAVHLRTINALALSEDGTRLLTASGDNTIGLWDTAEQRLLRRLVGHRGPVNDVAFVPGTTTAISASDDGTLIYWDLESAQPIRSFVGHNGPVVDLAVSRDGTRAISTTAIDDQPLLIWRIETLEDIVAWTSANRAIYTLSCEERLQFDLEPCQGDEPPAQQLISATAAVIPTEDAAPEQSTAEASEDTTLTNDAPTATPEPESIVTLSPASSQGVNVRSGDSTSFNLVGVLRAGESARVLGISTRDPNWLNIELPSGQRGWVSITAVRLDGELRGLPGITPPIVNSAPAAATQSTTNTGGQQAQPTADPAASICAALRITSPGALTDGITAFFWDKLTIPARYWVAIFSAETGAQVLIFDTGGDFNSLSLDTSVNNIGPGSQFRVEVTAFYEGGSCTTQATLPR